MRVRVQGLGLNLERGVVGAKRHAYCGRIYREGRYRFFDICRGKNVIHIVGGSIESVGIASLTSAHRMCSLAIECVLLLENAY